MQLVSVTKSGSCKIQDEKYEPIEGHASVTYQLHAEDLDGNGNILPKQRRLMDNTLVKMISDSVDASKVAKDEKKRPKGHLMKENRMRKWLEKKHLKQMLNSIPDGGKIRHHRYGDVELFTEKSIFDEVIDEFNNR